MSSVQTSSPCICAKLNVCISKWYDILTIVIHKTLEHFSINPFWVGYSSMNDMTTVPTVAKFRWCGDSPMVKIQTNSFQYLKIKYQN